MEKRKLSKKAVVLSAISVVLAVVLSLSVFADIGYLKTAFNAGLKTVNFVDKNDLLSGNFSGNKITFGKNELNWVVLGKDNGVQGDNAILVADKVIKHGEVFSVDGKNNITDTAKINVCSYPGNADITEVQPNHYGVSNIRNYLSNIAVSEEYFSEKEQEMMNITNVQTYDAKNSVTYSTADKLYLLNVVDGTVRAGSDSTKVVDVSDIKDSFWLRTPDTYMENKRDVKIVNDNGKIASNSVSLDNGVLPALNINLGSVLFAVNIPDNEYGIIDENLPLQFRVDGKNVALGTVVYSNKSNIITVDADSSAENGVKLIVVGNGTISGESKDWYYTKNVTGSLNISLDAIKTAVGITSDISFDDCKIWIETTENSVIYANKATEKVQQIGDVNDDDLINILDLVRLKRYLADNSKGIDLFAADINFDGYINSEDLVVLKNMLLGLEEVGDSVSVSDPQAIGFDGVIESGEYAGMTLDSTHGSSESKDYRLRTNAYILPDTNIMVALTIDSNVDFEAEVNNDNDWSKKLYAELAFGDNNGEVCQVYVDVTGRSKGAATAIGETVDNGTEATYRYSKIIELLIPRKLVDRNGEKNMVQFTRCALFHHQHANPERVNETWLVLRSAWNNAGMNNTTITNIGIVETWLLSGMDGVIADDEFTGSTINNNHTNTANYKMTMKGRMLKNGDGTKNGVRLSLKIESKIDPTTSVNGNNLFSDKMFAELSFGDHSGSGERINVIADVLGNAANCVSVVKNTDLGSEAEYRYETIIELWVPNSSITNGDRNDLVFIPRLGLFHQNVSGDAESWVVARWAGLYAWLRAEVNGLTA